jgi:hypothetical protein
MERLAMREAMGLNDLERDLSDASKRMVRP